jgi:mono/diheme cytochrome c family protein
MFDSLESLLGGDAGLWNESAFAARAIAEAARISTQYQDFDGKSDSAWTRFKMLWTVARHALDLANGDVESVVDGFDLPANRKRLMVARYYSMKSLYRALDPSLGGTTAGPGRTDPYAVAANYLFGGDGFRTPMRSPLRTRPLFGVKDKAWFEWTSNTNAILMRDVLGGTLLGGLTDVYGSAPTYATSLDFTNVGRLEALVNEQQAPTWPADLPLDTHLAARGRAVYVATCAGCHEPTRAANGLYTVRNVSLDVVGTDQGLVNQWTQIVPRRQGAAPLGVGIGDITTKLVDNYCAEQHLSRAECLRLNDTHDATDNPVGRRDPPKFVPTAPGYQAPRLDGAWAFGVFLHNGSVPTVADLLEPAAKRPKQFAVGHRTYDPTHLGYVTYPSLTNAARAAGATFVLDTSLPGNSNAGHEGDAFGTNLSDEDKLALLEYLKTHRSWQ